MILCYPGLPVLLVTLLRGWLVCCGCDVIWAIISNISITLSEFMLIWIPIVLLGIHVPFTLMICALLSTLFALLFWRNYILEYESRLVVH